VSFTAKRIGLQLFLWTCLTLLLLFLAIPVVAILTASTPNELIRSLQDEAAIDALLLSLRCTVIALLIILLVGTPTAWLLATRSFRGRSALTTIIELPLVLPPAVAGLALLAAFGPLGLFGGFFESAGIRLVLETAGVIVALVFVASPFYVRQAQAAFAAIDRETLEASRTLGAGEGRTFLRVAVPTAAGGLGSGAALAWARALGEFGATLMFAGSLQSITQTAPLAVYDLFGTNFVGAEALAAVLIACSAALLLVSKLSLQRSGYGDVQR